MLALHLLGAAAALAWGLRRFIRDETQYRRRCPRCRYPGRYHLRFNPFPDVPDYGWDIRCFNKVCRPAGPPAPPSSEDDFDPPFPA